MQSTVVSSGATFAVQAVEIGANQVPIPIGDATFVTCGPFDCAEGTAAPEISIANSAACTAWAPTFDLAVGKVNNTGDDDPKTDTDTGIDLGWSYTSSAGFTATHDIVVTSGKSAAVKATSTEKSLVVPTVGAGILGSSSDSCEKSYEPTIGTVQEPGDECFRVKLQGSNDYLSNYTVSLASSGTSVSWGEIAWDAFDDLDCPAKTYAAASDADICELLTEEVGELAKPGVSPRFDGGKENAAKLVGFDVMFGTAEHYRFTDLWYMQSTKSGASKVAGEENTVDIYTGDGGVDIGGGTVSMDGAKMSWIVTIDEDDDPKAEFGDLGLIDTGGTDEPENYSGNDDVMCSADDGGSAKTKDDNVDGTLCDAEVEFMTSVTFVDGLDLGCSETLDLTVTCSWDADGGAVVASDGTTRSTAQIFDPKTAGTEEDKFLKCEVE